MINHHKNSFYFFSVITYKEISISLPLCSRLRGDFCRGWNPQKRIMKSENQLCLILEPEKTFSTSSPFIHSLFNMYLNLEAINVLLKYHVGVTTLVTHLTIPATNAVEKNFYIFCKLYLLYFIPYRIFIIYNHMFSYYTFCNCIFCNYVLCYWVQT